MNSYRDNKESIGEAQRRIKHLKIKDADLTHYIGEGDLSPGCLACKEGTWFCIYVTRYCNLNCYYCPQKNDYHNNNRQQTEANEPFFRVNNHGVEYLYESFKELIINSKDSINGISYSGGEPFLAVERIVQLANICLQVKPQLYQWVYTNGALVSEDNLKLVKAHNVKEIRFDWAAQGFNPDLLSKMEIAARLGFKVVVEVPMHNREVIRTRFMPLIGSMVSAGVSQLNCAELMIRLANEADLKMKNDNIYIHENGQLSPIWSRHLTYEIMNKVETENIKLVVNDCSNDTKLLQMIQRNRRPAPEKKFIRELIRLSLGNGEESKLKEYQLKSNLKLLKNEVRNYQLEGFLYFNLKGYKNKELIAEELITSWKEASARASVRNLLHENNLTLINQEFSEKGIDYVILNGFAYADDRKDRKVSMEINNLDLAVRENNFGCAIKVLLDLRYEKTESNELYPLYQRLEESDESRRAPVAFKAKTGKMSYIINLWSELPFKEIIESRDFSTLVQLGGKEFYCLNVSAYFAFLLLNYSARKNYVGWKWFAEVCMLVSDFHEFLDWDEVYSLVGDCNEQRFLKNTIQAATGFLDETNRFEINKSTLLNSGFLNYPEKCNLFKKLSAKPGSLSSVWLD